MSDLYYQKYLKYKTKYTQLKQSGGSNSSNNSSSSEIINNEVQLKFNIVNTNGTFIAKIVNPNDDVVKKKIETIASWIINKATASPPAAAPQDTTTEPQQQQDPNNSRTPTTAANPPRRNSSSKPPRRNSRPNNSSPAADPPPLPTIKEKELLEDIFRNCKRPTELDDLKENIQNLKNLKNLPKDYNIMDYIDESTKYNCLMIAALNGNTEIVEYLITNYVNKDNINTKNIKDSKTALILACYNGHVGVVKQLLDVDGINVNEQDNQGFTSLMIACNRQNFDIVHKLLEKGADVNKQNNTGNTALIIACGRQNVDVDIIQKLLEKGTDVNIKNKFGNTALMIACNEQKFDIVHKLLENGANILLKNKNNKDALKLATDHFLIIPYLNFKLNKDENYIQSEIEKLEKAKERQSEEVIKQIDIVIKLGQELLK